MCVVWPILIGARQVMCTCRSMLHTIYDRDIPLPGRSSHHGNRGLESALPGTFWGNLFLVPLFLAAENPIKTNVLLLALLLSTA